MFNMGVLWQATWETIYMVFIASLLGIIGGLVLGVLLFITGKKQALQNAWLHNGLGLIVNITRSTPFIILMICLIPLTRWLIGTSIGTNAAIVPLTIAAIPFFARVAESALQEIPYGLIEAAHAMGASTWQIICKVLLPESTPALIRGATLTIIGLIGYSAMAGVVGGGGLGELAINYGYQRFDAMVMLETVVLLIIMVQLIQMAGDRLAKSHRLRPLIVASVLLGAICLLTQCWPDKQLSGAVIRVGVMSGQPETIMQVAKDVALKQYGMKLTIVAFNDYVQPNTALNNRSIDANIFQHLPYLEAQLKAHSYQITPIAKSYVYPMGFYSHRLREIKNIPQGALVAIPNDPSNGGRALLLLEKVGLIRLKPNVGTLATVNDIAENPHQLRFKLLDAAELPRVLDDADLVAVTNDFVGPAGLTIKQAIIKEGNDSPYANIIVVRTEDKNKQEMKNLVEVMHSQPVMDVTEKLFPDGAAVPGWR